jgi:WD40 repeat protein
MINWFNDDKISLHGHSSKVSSIAKFSNNIIISGSNGEIKLWNVKSRKCIKSYAINNTATVESLTIVDQKTIAFYNGSINVYNLNDGSIQFSMDIGNIFSIITIKKGVLGLCGNDDKVRLWSIVDNNITEIISHNHVICLSRFSDNMYLSGGCDGFVKMWNMSDKSLIKTFNMYGWIICILTLD